MKTQYEITLHYGCKAKGHAHDHAFTATDPATIVTADTVSDALHDQFVKAEGVAPSIYAYGYGRIPLPETLIRRIQEEAIAAYLEKGAAFFVQNHRAFAEEVFGLIYMQNCR